MKIPVCVVVGVGPGNGDRPGSALHCRRLRRCLDGAQRRAEQRPGGGTDGARAYECDVADAASVKNAFARVSVDLGEVEVLIYNAGSGSWGSVEEITPGRSCS